MPDLLAPRDARAVRRLIDRIRREVPAELVQAALFGSRARRRARPDSDIDILLVFRSLPPDREPHASRAERIADEVAARTGAPVTVWSVSMGDLACGFRTPMLVDALADALPLWCAGRPLPRLRFTPDDAVRCVEALLDRVAEGGADLAEALRAGDQARAARRIRDDLVRMCVALHLARGHTRPRRGDAAELVLASGSRFSPALRRALRWAADSFGPQGRDEERPVAPPGDVREAARAVAELRRHVIRRLESLKDAGGRAPDLQPLRG